jgi:hypothetical protein
MVLPALNNRTQVHQNSKVVNRGWWEASLRGEGRGAYSVQCIFELAVCDNVDDVSAVHGTQPAPDILGCLRRRIQLFRARARARALV